MSTSPSIWFLTSEFEGERAGSFRQERWARLFLERGWRVRVFNVRGAFGLADIPLTSIAELDKVRERKAQAPGPKASVREGVLARTLRMAKHLLLVDLYYPNLFTLARRASRGIEASEAQVVVMCSSPPFALAVVGWWLKQRYPSRVTLCVDMRDAWALHGALGGIRPLKCAIERAVLRAADRVSTVAQGLREEFREYYGVNAALIYNVATHYRHTSVPDPMPLEEVSQEALPGSLRLIYTGSTPVGHYDAEAIVEGVGRFRDENPDLADRVQLVFVGACEEIAREASRRGRRNPSLVFIPHLPNDVTRRVQAGADALMFLGHRGPRNSGVVSTKIFEYMALGIPILPICLEPLSDVDTLLLRICGRTIHATNVVTIANLLASVAREGTQALPRTTDPAALWALCDAYGTFEAELPSSPARFTDAQVLARG
jgi:glycosyltransferase involved in cell wall biosynthesis